MAKVEVIVSTLDDGINSIDLSFVSNDYALLIIHQISEFKYYDYSRFLNLNVRVVVSKELGLSKSRNLAIRYAEGQFILLSDDDMIYEKENLEKIYRYFYHGYDLITFKIKNKDNKPFRDYPNINNNKNILSYNFCSCEMAFRASFIRGFNYDDDFGLGAKYPAFEELILIHDIFSSGKGCFYFCDEYLALHFDDSHTGLNITDKYCQSYGAFLRRTRDSLFFAKVFKFSFGNFFRTRDLIKSLKIIYHSFSGYFRYHF
ncbi:glycosyltransferase [Vibrio cholerae]|nr:glycosyltransferase [Vibrio cholerae]BCN19128.1 putative glycosyltransferase [Vibrio cholerae]GIA94049.1 glycosyltransferase [Vibrio cholerae]